MKNLPARCVASMLTCLLSVSLLAGCATEHNSKPDSLSPQEQRVLYPRQYLDSLPPSERSAAERQMMGNPSRKRWNWWGRL